MVTVPSTFTLVYIYIYMYMYVHKSWSVSPSELGKLCFLFFWGGGGSTIYKNIFLNKVSLVQVVSYLQIKWSRIIIPRAIFPLFTSFFLIAPTFACSFHLIQGGRPRTCWQSRGFPLRLKRGKSRKHVDGRNPKQPLGMYKTLVNNGIFTWLICKISH